MIEDEQNLITRAKGGEAEAFGLLYDFYMPRIYRFILLKISHREEAEDLTHQVFLKAWKSIGSYKHQGHPFGSWLYRIARNTVVDHHRKSKPEVDIEYIAHELVSTDTSPDANAETKFQWEGLMISIKKLKDIEQNVLIMRFVEDMPHREVAKAVGKTEGAVKIIQHRALKTLKKLIEND